MKIVYLKLQWLGSDEVKRHVSLQQQIGWGHKALLFLIITVLSRVRLSPLGTAATTNLPYQPQMIDDGDCGAIGGIKIGRGNRSSRRKPAPASLCPPQIPHDQTRARTRTAAVGSQQLTAWSMTSPYHRAPAVV
jgi:hypothetical protein